MTKSKRRNRSGRRQVTTTADSGSQAGNGAQSAAQPARRRSLKRMRNWALVAGAVGAGSWYVGSEVVAAIEEEDLSKIGNGKPTIVQIHDPRCPTCRALQARVHLALDRIDDDNLQYLVANIRKTPGRELAREHGVPHVTLLLFDGQGRRRQVLRGMKHRDELVRAFRQLLATTAG